MMRFDCLMGNMANDTANGTAQTRNPNIIAFLMECMIYFPFYPFLMMLRDGSVIFKGIQNQSRFAVPSGRRPQAVT
jgi:hypothetical protein